MLLLNASWWVEGHKVQQLLFQLAPPTCPHELQEDSVHHREMFMSTLIPHSSGEGQQDFCLLEECLTAILLTSEGMWWTLNQYLWNWKITRCASVSLTAVMSSASPPISRLFCILNISTDVFSCDLNIQSIKGQNCRLCSPEVSEPPQLHFRLQHWRIQTSAGRQSTLF